MERKSRCREFWRLGFGGVLCLERVARYSTRRLWRLDFPGSASQTREASVCRLARLVASCVAVLAGRVVRVPRKLSRSPLVLLLALIRSARLSAFHCDCYSTFKAAIVRGRAQGVVGVKNLAKEWSPPLLLKDARLKCEPMHPVQFQAEQRSSGSCTPQKLRAGWRISMPSSKEPGTFGLLTEITRNSRTS